MFLKGTYSTNAQFRELYNVTNTDYILDKNNILLIYPDQLKD